MVILDLVLKLRRLYMY